MNDTPCSSFRRKSLMGVWLLVIADEEQIASFADFEKNTVRLRVLRMVLKAGLI